MRFIKPLVYILILSVLAGCGKYQKVLKNPDPNKKLEMAQYYYNKKDYYRASTLFEQLQDNFTGTAMAEKVIFYSAYCNFGLRNYPLSGYQFKSYFENFPTGQWAEESLYMNAYCQFLESQNYYLDQTDTHKASEALKLFVSVYPESKYVSECNLLLDKLREKLSFKAYNSAKLYYNIGEYKSAVVALQNVIKDYPEIAQKEELEFLTLKSQYLLARNSIEEKQKERFETGIDFYTNFIAEYPKSEYTDEANNIYSKINTALLKLNTKNQNKN
ncbi:MAG: outer membrane protein assembly factor BamD [Bacteroidia bacterium]|nr:outer membrane protein assembly factor BamD [Bacteroidia bacterium]MCC7533580.1 outer membrane protein assembly factor BamD [Bacteroidia bacterium]